MIIPASSLLPGGAVAADSARGTYNHPSERLTGFWNKSSWWQDAANYCAVHRHRPHDLLPFKIHMRRQSRVWAFLIMQIALALIGGFHLACAIETGEASNSLANVEEEKSNENQATASTSSTTSENSISGSDVTTTTASMATENVAGSWFTETLDSEHVADDVVHNNVDLYDSNNDNDFEERMNATYQKAGNDGYILRSVQSLYDLLFSSTVNSTHKNNVLFALLYSDSCLLQQHQQEHSSNSTTAMFRAWEKAAEILESESATLATSGNNATRIKPKLPPPLLATMELDSFKLFLQQQEQQQLTMILDPKSKLETLPAIAIVVGNGKEVRLWNVIEDYQYDFPYSIVVDGEGRSSSHRKHGQRRRTLQHRLLHDSFQIVKLYWHYYSRLVMGSVVTTTGEPPQAMTRDNQAHTHNDDSALVATPSIPLHFDSLDQVQYFVCTHFDRLFLSVPYKPLPLVGTYKDHERRQSLLDGASHDDFVVFLQCQNHDQRSSVDDAKRVETLYRTFQQLSHAMFPRQDLLHVSVSDCSKQEEGGMPDGSVFVWRYSGHISPSSGQSAQICRVASSHQWLAQASREVERKNDLKHFHLVHATPSLLWYDRRLTAPIMLDHDVQALLFVSMHPFPPDFDEQEEEARQVSLVRHFGSLCEEWRHDQKNSDEIGQFNDQREMVCVIVPSTETRLLSTFGVDIWSPLDQHLMDYMEAMASGDVDTDLLRTPRVLPQLVLLDRRHRRHEHDKSFGSPVRLYRLSEPTDESISDFLQDFWHNRLTPEIKTSSLARAASGQEDAIADEPTINLYGVHKLTGRYWWNIMKKSANTGSRLSSDGMQKRAYKHALILFVSPTCGHCQRIMVMFNQLSAVLGQAPGWRDLLTLFFLDVSTDEIPTVNPIRWLPDLLYVGTKPIANMTSPTAASPVAAGAASQDNIGAGMGVDEEASPTVNTSSFDSEEGTLRQIHFNDHYSNNASNQHKHKQRRLALLGEITHYANMLEWLIQVMELEDEDEWKTLLANLQHQLASS
ncbi:hypothetical protein ACA910_020899 [Epithemia clementina (nom. ined.)]